MNNAKKYLPVVAAVALMAIGGVLQGKWSERWGSFPELQVLTAQMSEIPKQIGEWQGEDEEQSDEKILKIAGAEGELVRTYKNANGDMVRVSMICARLQDIFYHSPDRCYPAAGFEMQGEPQPEVFEIGDTTAEFFTTSFLKSEPTGTHSERGYWAWSGDGTWKASKNPKLEFANDAHALFKLYIFASVPALTKQKSGDHDFCQDFIRAFVPAVERALRPALVKAGRVKPEATDTVAPTEPTAQPAASPAG
ncbi:MAG TPA: EpsI family protein [Pirellulales bacterium]|nr:EpsI family protein [Pirellulales bacterium]